MDLKEYKRRACKSQSDAVGRIRKGRRVFLSFYGEAGKAMPLAHHFVRDALKQNNTILSFLEY